MNLKQKVIIIIVLLAMLASSFMAMGNTNDKMTHVDYIVSTSSAEPSKEGY